MIITSLPTICNTIFFSISICPLVFSMQCFFFFLFQTLKVFCYPICLFYSYGVSLCYHVNKGLSHPPPSPILQKDFPVFMKPVQCIRLSLCLTLFPLWSFTFKICIPYHQISLNHHLVLLITFLSFHLCSKPIPGSHKFLIWIVPNLPNWFLSIHLRLKGMSMLFQVHIHYLHAEGEFWPFSQKAFLSN